jgi:hypothetical protein
MERTMNMIGLNAHTVHRRHMLRWAGVIGGISVAVLTGLLTVKSFSTAAADPHAAGIVGVNQPTAVSQPTTSEIVPSPVIESNPQFFFGTGDGGNGYYADHPRP